MAGAEEPIDTSGSDSDDSDDDSEAEATLAMGNLASLVSAEVVKMSVRRKTLAAIMHEKDAAEELGGPKLALFDLICIGIGSCVGTGVFVLTGEVLPVAGPAATLSWCFAGVACLLSGLCYMELSARLPTKGSTYVFSFHSLGELAAVVSSVCLSLEYGVSGAGVARSWSKSVAVLINNLSFTKFFFLPYRDLEGITGQALRRANSTRVEVEPPPPDTVQSILEAPHLDWLAGIIMLLCVIVISGGGDCGKLFINVFTIAKVLLIAFMTVGCLAHWNQNIFESYDTFAPQGTAGIFNGATLLFFGFIGFDEVCCLASRSKDPAKTMPRAIAGTLLGATVISCSAQLALSCVSPPSDGASSFFEAFHSFGMPWAANLVKVGEAVLLPLVVFVSFLPQPELMAAMAEDGVLPSIFCRTDKGGNYMSGSLISGSVMILLAVCVPFSILWDVISLGVLVGFNFTSAALIQLRYRNGGTLRSHRVSVLTWSAVLCAGGGTYILWKGYLNEALNGGDNHQGSVACLWIGLGLIVAELCILGVLSFSFEQIREGEYSAEVFKVPLVPWLPGIGLVINFFMSSTISWASHIFFLLLVVVVLALYAMKRLHARYKRRKGTASGMEAIIKEQDGRIGELELEVDRLRAALAAAQQPQQPPAAS